MVFKASASKLTQRLAGQKSVSDTLAADQATESNLVHQHLQVSKLLGGRDGGRVLVCVCVFVWVGLDEVCALGHTQ